MSAFRNLAGRAPGSGNRAGELLVSPVAINYNLCALDH